VTAQFYLAAIFELTREVFLLDQSDAHTTSSAKTAQELFGINTVDICAQIVQNACLKIARQLICNSFHGSVFNVLSVSGPCCIRVVSQN
jgi:4-diphosphocytidyl-2C-methyl-D-erythritol kinase